MCRCIAEIKRTDRIVSINGRSVAGMQDVVSETRRNPTASVEIRSMDGGVRTVTLQSARITP